MKNPFASKSVSHPRISYFSRFSLTITLFMLGTLTSIVHAQEGPPVEPSPAGAGNTIVNSKFGGQIFGFEIDQTGTEGVLSESQDIGGGKFLSAVETFDQKTGAILKVVQQLRSKDDFLTLGVTGGGIGLIEREHVQNIFVNKRTYHVIKPLGANQFTGMWTPALTKDDIITNISRSQQTPHVAVLGFRNSGSNPPFLFASNVAANTFGPRLTLTDPVFSTTNFPQLAYDSTKNRAVIAVSIGAVGGPPPVIAQVNLATGAITKFNGLPGPFPFRQGFINGLAVDFADGIACTTTEVDFRVEFYDLKKKTGFAVVLQGANGQLQSGTDVEYDAIHKLFLIAQPVSSTGIGSSIQVYNTKGNFVKSLNGFNFSNTFNVFPVHIALNPANRSGYVDGPSSGVTQIQSFTY